ncbi:hypothetical protein [Lacinutrix sp. Hel_I_90]|uniref:hypothetical protein n=1 Tax=Lacinutrix sp. Hel_I_90 TaxID=1249999 RepID=UPI001E513557|nr:hypothetical protein [Lacinutrix sp. Hel_I_90]
MNVLQNFRKITVLLLISIAQAQFLSAHEKNRACNNHYKHTFFCDLCGCSTSSGSFGFGTLSNANFVGVRYLYQNFESKNGIFENSPTSKEVFRTYQLWAQIPVIKTFYLSANVPYHDLSRTFNGITENIYGLGDSSLIGWYKLIFYKKQNEETLNFDVKKEASGHSIQFGLGLKLPTGEFEERLADNINPGFQVGTGSTDGILSFGYNYGGNTLGVNTLFSYYLKGENKNEYQFGNQFSYTTNLYTALSTKKMNIMPFLGVSGDIYSSIKQYGETLNDTDGSIINASLGSEFAVEDFIFGASYTLPVNQNLFGHDVKSKQRISVYINYAL